MELAVKRLEAELTAVVERYGMHSRIKTRCAFSHGAIHIIIQAQDQPFDKCEAPEFSIIPDWRMPA